ncbi:putative x-pro dipeptidyl- protein [Phaeoacremonium minimum UCRPA7]|uniref:Putative x-pro dipeptidyl-protein n=1 Tax=Phaeoacremonium minimum (strain UCR-PA7) TaxID=1286976 RepID=R8BVI5_PHAM7|nr:putative x-pro dipeptidyl- protein [Phaeoacremonium minimum UCRPA7]EOO03363.1 putative x-pro dipeptidyl- protein [Phaeoacremonium minimum UCRPA7]
MGLSQALPQMSSDVAQSSSVIFEGSWDNVDMSEAEGLSLAIENPFQQLVEDESMSDRVARVREDEKELKKFWTLEFSPRRYNELYTLYSDELENLEGCPFNSYGQEDRVDYLLLKGYLERSRRRLELDEARDKKMEPLLPFAPPLVELWEARREVKLEVLEPKRIAQLVHEATKIITQTQSKIEAGSLSVDKTAAFRAVRTIGSLRTHLDELCSFFKGYNPLFDWWVAAPYKKLDEALQALVPVIQFKLAGMKPDAKDEIVGEPIGRDGLLVDLEAECIPYTPEELLVIAKKKYAWCEKEMKKASHELGFGDDWREALEHVRNIYPEPGKMPELVKELVDGGVEYVKKHDLITVPPLAEKLIRMDMMSPEWQKVNPFFLGGRWIIVSYPTDTMEHEDKLMSMRGNGRHLSKATAFHEMIPGHHLQGYVATRNRKYRNLFTTPFYVEGWAMYWELIFWDRGDFFSSPEDRVGTLFWRMHRCARILFSLKFHLGQLTPQECVDLLVDMVGHERATAEGEVRRSLNGDYSPLYQAGYFLGALQLYALRSEVLGSKKYTEKEFHDRVLKANTMPIEMLRALLLEKELSKDYKSQWKFYGDISTPLPFKLFSSRMSGQNC